MYSTYVGWAPPTIPCKVHTAHQPLRVSVESQAVWYKKLPTFSQVNQTDQMVKISPATLQHLFDTVRYAAQMYKVELSAILDADEVFNDPPRRNSSIIRTSGSKANRANYRRSGESFFTLPQVVVVFEVGDTANPTGLMSG